MVRASIISFRGEQRHELYKITGLYSKLSEKVQGFCDYWLSFDLICWGEGSVLSFIFGALSRIS